MRSGRGCFALGVTTLIVAACNSGGSKSAPPACDASCQDNIAIRAYREIIKQVFNGAIQNQPVGNQDATYTCAPLGGTAHITGTATANADVGTTTVSLTYDFKDCRYVQLDTDPNQSYDITLTGTAIETGVIAQQPGSTTALSLTSSAMTITGSVYAPPLSYSTDDTEAGPSDDDAGAGCDVELSQNGNQLSGTICGRTAGVDL